MFRFLETSKCQNLKQVVKSLSPTSMLQPPPPPASPRPESNSPSITDDSEGDADEILSENNSNSNEENQTNEDQKRESDELDFVENLKKRLTVENLQLHECVQLFQGAEMAKEHSDNDSVGVLEGSERFFNFFFSIFL